MAMIIESETELVDTGVMALAINLALSEPIAERICFANGQERAGAASRCCSSAPSSARTCSS